MKNICKRTLCAALALGMALLPAGATNWGLWYGNGLHQPPNGEDTVQTLAKYGAYYMGSADEKTLYLTFDCGYENGKYCQKYWIPSKKQHVPGAFFVVGDYLKTAPALVRRMGDEGHLVGNHTNNHPNMSKVGKERFTSELTAVSSQYRQLTGRSIAPFYRPPEGRIPMIISAGHSRSATTRRCGASRMQTGTRRRSRPMLPRSRPSVRARTTEPSSCCMRSPRLMRRS